MLTHAGELGANAVIGVRYDATEIARASRRSLLRHGGVCGEGGLSEGIKRRQSHGAMAGRLRPASAVIRTGSSGRKWPVRWLRALLGPVPEADMNRDLVGPNQSTSAYMASRRNFPAGRPGGGGGKP